MKQYSSYLTKQVNYIYTRKEYFKQTKMLNLLNQNQILDSAVSFICHLKLYNINF